MSTPVAAGTLFDCWIGGLPTATLPRILLLVAAANTTMPFVLPMAVFSSTRLLLPDKTPIPKSTAGPAAYPFPLVSFHRSELLLPWSHMPPQEADDVPFLTATFPSTLISDEVGLIRIPD